MDTDVPSDRHHRWATVLPLLFFSALCLSFKSPFPSRAVGINILYHFIIPQSSFCSSFYSLFSFILSPLVGVNFKNILIMKVLWQSPLFVLKNFSLICSDIDIIISSPYNPGKTYFYNNSWFSNSYSTNCIAMLYHGASISWVWHPPIP